MVVGGSWGATLALAYAQAHPDRVSGLVLRATFLGTRAEVETAFTDVLARVYPGLHEDFLALLPSAERARPVEAYWRRILDPDPGRARPGRARLERHRTHSLRTYALAQPARSGLAAIDAPPARDTLHGGALFHQRQLHAAEPLLDEAGKLAGIPGIIVQGRYDLLCPPATSHALRAVWSEADIRIIEGAGHMLYDPGIRDAVMRAIADMASILWTAAASPAYPLVLRSLRQQASPDDALHHLEKEAVRK